MSHVPSVPSTAPYLNSRLAGSLTAEYVIHTAEGLVLLNEFEWLQCGPGPGRLPIQRVGIVTGPRLSASRDAGMRFRRFGLCLGCDAAQRLGRALSGWVGGGSGMDRWKFLIVCGEGEDFIRCIIY